MPPGTLLLDFIRYHAGLKGTKIGCREGDCGACTILSGQLINDRLVYKSITSCLMPIGNANHCHIVTIEGINGQGLTPVQQCFAEEGATQCGFCTPGFIVALTGYCVSDQKPTYEGALDAINGNICRCTGYKSIERALTNFNELVKSNDKLSISTSINNHIVPNYFQEIEERLSKWKESGSQKPLQQGQRIVGGGTDLYVQQHEAMVHADIFFAGITDTVSITRIGNLCVINASATVADIASSNIFKEAFPELQGYMKLVSSTQIRNMATLAGNFCNASPIGDLTIFFLALNASLTIKHGESQREVALQDFYMSYKVIDLLESERVETISFELPLKSHAFNFEKVSKRTHLDIASVNSAMLIEIREDVITSARIAAGGVSPIPLYLSKSSAFLENKKISIDVVGALLEIVEEEISPISDARGSAEYKKLLLTQLIKAHFIKLFPSIRWESLITAIS